MIRSSLLFRDAIPGVTYYASGSNHAGEVLGFAEAGIHVGVSARETRDLTEQALCYAVREYKARVFVDSGAFSEVAFGARGEPPVVGRGAPLSASTSAPKADNASKVPPPQRVKDLLSRLGDCMIADRHRLHGRLRSLERASPERAASELDRLAQDVDRSEGRAAERRKRPASLGDRRRDWYILGRAVSRSPR